MMNFRKPASPFGQMPEQGGQYGANANPNGNGWGQQFMQQYGAPPGQMKDEWSQFKQTNGFGGGQPEGMGQGMAPQEPQMGQQNPMQSWQGMRPQMGGMGMGGQPDRMQMLRAWLGQRRGLLGQ